jgi:hypothetical protein
MFHLQNGEASSKTRQSFPLRAKLDSFIPTRCDCAPKAQLNKALSDLALK